jgi:voltage-gated potassium channel
VADTSEETPDEAVEEVFYPTDRIPFVNWSQFSGAKPTVVLTGVVTILAFVTGLSNLSQTAIALDGPLAPVIPMERLFARFAGVMSAFLLGLVTVGLQRRKQLAWRMSMLVLPVLAMLPLTTLQTTDIPMFLVILVTYPMLIWNRDRFDQTIDLSPLQIASLLSILGVGLYGTMGSFGLRDQFVELDTWGDAVYYVIVTIATVGYGDITPLSAEAKWFSLSVIVFGTGAFTVAVGALIGPAIESRMAAAFGNMTASDLTLLEDHVVILGHGNVTESLLEELESEADTVVVTQNTDVATALDDEGVNVLTEDPTEAGPLEDARVDAARGVVVGSDDDATNVLAVIETRNVAPEVRLVAVANEESNVAKLESVGADEVVNPGEIGGTLLGRSVLGESATVAALLADESGAEAEAGRDNE